MNQSSCLDGMQGTNEERTEAYLKYGDGAPQFVTQQSAKSGSGATGLAGWQVVASRRLV